MTNESLNNLILNLKIKAKDLGEKVNNKLKYDINCLCEDGRKLQILDAIIDMFICYQLPCPDGDATCVTRILDHQIASETCGGTFAGDTTIYINVIDNVLNTSISTLGLEEGVYLSASTILQSGTYITDIIVDGLVSTLVLNKQTLSTNVGTTITVDCTEITHIAKSNCLTVLQMENLLRVANQICGTNYCADFEITIDS